MILIAATREGYKEIGRFAAIDGKARNGPVLAGNRLFLRSGEEMAAYDVNTEGKSASRERTNVGR